MLNDALSTLPRRDRRTWLQLIGDPHAFLGPAAEHVTTGRRRWRGIAAAAAAVAGLGAVLVTIWR